MSSPADDPAKHLWISATGFALQRQLLADGLRVPFLNAEQLRGILQSVDRAERTPFQEFAPVILLHQDGTQFYAGVVMRNAPAKTVFVPALSLDETMDTKDMARRLRTTIEGKEEEEK